MEQQFFDLFEAMDLDGREPIVEKGLLELMKETADDLPSGLQSTSVKRQRVHAEKGLLDLPLNLMHEVFAPLDARSLLETANSHDTLRKQVALWPDKNWDFVYRSGRTIFIDNDVFESTGAGVLLQNYVYDQENGAKVTETSANICDLPYVLLWRIMEALDPKDLLSVAKSHPNLLQATKNLKNKRFDVVLCGQNGVGFRWFPMDPVATFTYVEAEILLTGASVDLLEYDDAATMDAKATKFAVGLPRVLGKVPRIYFPKLPTEWFRYVPGWTFSSLDFYLNTDVKEAAPQLQAMFQKLYDQWIFGERDLFGIGTDISTDQGSALETLKVGGQSIKPFSHHSADRDDRWSLLWGCQRIKRAYNLYMQTTYAHDAFRLQDDYSEDDYSSVDDSSDDDSDYDRD